MLNVIALVFAGILVAGVAVAIGSSSAGPSIGVAAAELQKLAPNYWHNAAGKMSYNIIQAPSLVGPAWTPDLLPSGGRPKPAKRPPLQALPRSMAEEPPLSFEDDLFELPANDASDVAGYWADSPSPLGRVGNAA